MNRRGFALIILIIALLAIIAAGTVYYFYAKPQPLKPLESPQTIQPSSDKINVSIEGKDRAIRNVKEEAIIGWNYPFYGIDTTDGLVGLCKEQKRCFELTWSSSSIKFLKSAFKNFGKDSKGSTIIGNTSIDNPEDLQSTLTTQLRHLECMFGGNGEQSITLEAKENGKTLGTDTYKFKVDGSSSRPTICKIQGDYFLDIPENIP